MTAMVLLAFGIGAGLELAAAAAIAAVVFNPLAGLVAAVAWALFERLRRSGADDEVEILAAVAGDLRSGRSLRQSLGAVGQARPGHPVEIVGRQALAGVPVADLAPMLARALPAAGSLVVPAVAVLAVSGGRAGPIFEQLAASRALTASLERERRAALAPARLSAGILLALPAAYLGWLIATDRLAGLVADPVGRILALCGLGLITAGLAVFAGLVKRGMRWS